MVTSLGFGHVSALIALVHPAAFKAALGERAEEWRAAAEAREAAGLRRIVDAMHGGASLYEKPVDRNLGSTGQAAKEREAAMLLSENARLIDGVMQANQ